MTFCSIVVRGAGAEDTVLRALEHAWPVRFVQDAQPLSEPGVHFSHRVRTAQGEILERTIRFPRAAADTGRRAGFSVHFAPSELLDESVRGRVLVHQGAVNVIPGAAAVPTAVLATADGMPVWTWTAHGISTAEQVDVPLPILTEDTRAGDFLNADRFLELLPLFQFVKRALRESGWRFPAARAALMFDDPNLHWRSYGYVSYPDILRDSIRSNYHVCFATIPLDTWFTHRSTAALFLRHPDRLSLLLHGNDHTYAELAKLAGPIASRTAIGQAMRRAEMLRRRTGIQINRTMAAPHGACSRTTMEAMMELGVESLFCSNGSLCDWNPATSWPAEFGVMPAEMLPSGFAILPRFRISLQGEPASVISAFLGRPIVPVGHHDDLRDTPDLLTSVASTINRIPAVVWADAQSISRANYLWCTPAGTGVLHVLPFSSLVNVPVPADVHSVVIYRPSQPHVTECTSDWSVAGDPGARPSTEGAALRVTPGTTVTLKRRTLGIVDPATVTRRQTGLGPMLRRALCETRDRLAPAVTAAHRLVS